MIDPIGRPTLLLLNFIWGVYHYIKYSYVEENKHHGDTTHLQDTRATATQTEAKPQQTQNHKKKHTAPNQRKAARNHCNDHVRRSARPPERRRGTAQRKTKTPRSEPTNKTHNQAQPQNRTTAPQRAHPIIESGLGYPFSRGVDRGLVTRHDKRSVPQNSSTEPRPS